MIMTGEIKSFSPFHGYGYITVAGIDYWFHNEDWMLRIPPVKGLKVDFEPYDSAKGLRASKINIRTDQ